MACNKILNQTPETSVKRENLSTGNSSDTVAATESLLQGAAAAPPRAHRGGFTNTGLPGLGETAAPESGAEAQAGPGPGRRAARPLAARQRASRAARRAGSTGQHRHAQAPSGLHKPRPPLRPSRAELPCRGRPGPGPGGHRRSAGRHGTGPRLAVAPPLPPTRRSPTAADKQGPAAARSAALPVPALGFASLPATAPAGPRGRPCPFRRQQGAPRQAPPFRSAHLRPPSAACAAGAAASQSPPADGPRQPIGAEEAGRPGRARARHGGPWRRRRDLQRGQTRTWARAPRRARAGTASARLHRAGQEPGAAVPGWARGSVPCGHFPCARAA